MKEKYKDLGKNTLIFAIGQFGTKFLSFFLIPLYTNILTTAEYGIADLITGTAQILIYVFTLNIAAGVLRYAIEQYYDRKNILSYGVTIVLKGSVILGIIILLVKQLNIINWPNYYYLILFLNFFINAIYNLFSNYLRTINKIKEIATCGVISSLSTILCNILFLLVIKIGINGYLISLLVGPLVGTIYAIYKSDFSIKDLKNEGNKKLNKEIKGYCIPLIFNDLAVWINGNLDKYFITMICGVDQNGIYSIASKIPNILGTCVTVFNQAWALSAFKEYNNTNDDHFIENTYKIYNTLMCILCTLLILANIPISRILYAKDFFEAWRYSSILLIAIMFNSMTAFLGQLFGAIKQPKVIMLTTIASAIVNTILNAILIPKYGVLGAAIATAVAYIVMFSIRYVVIKNYIQFNTNITKEILIYILLILQVIFEHMNNHFYMGQIIIVLAIISINYRDIKKLINKIILTMKGRFAHE